MDEKNSLSTRYADSTTNNRISYKIRGLEYTSSTFFEKFAPDMKSPWEMSREEREIYNKNKKRYVTGPIRKKLQAYFDKVCGPGRVKVSVQDNIRLILPESFKTFKMIP